MKVQESSTMLIQNWLMVSVVKILSLQSLSDKHRDLETQIEKHENEVKIFRQIAIALIIALIGTIGTLIGVIGTLD